MSAYFGEVWLLPWVPYTMCIYPGLEGEGVRVQHDPSKGFGVRGAGIWVVVKIMVLIGVPIIIQHIISRVPIKGP